MWVLNLLGAGVAASAVLGLLWGWVIGEFVS
jgi:hypothetical protein